MTEFTVEIIDDDEAEQADAVACMRVEDMPVANFDDDVITVCAMCGVAIRHRPYMPKRPPKVCIQCAFTLANRTVQ